MLDGEPGRLLERFEIPAGLLGTPGLLGTVLLFGDPERTGPPPRLLIP